ncbi:acyl-CoA dehydrogenase family protein [Paraburkholderia tropica]|jgi:acyl-CoA dehydrogenase|uniref:Acyl-[acyl-carrier-protein] dehydrogenase MbtN n=1 Tax=Paraburkholderia tropica TaxID=92647 RepID=A0A1A5XLH1_9BURK|nr:MULTISPECIES: acyl-CoA dehydrogenase family protein [Paraburkholderia]MBB2979953.1 acyl-CoA dehydrogenase [Paraburkholderia tropica]MBB3002800.1 acyl-CoA dehydrogenase [Paraburkholderia tropica]MBB6321842.1 acyl-CoA dehydrogenase [Paraburkholderia tropica]MDE1140431.1 acyl-CoA dehydrogenase family protein [Paraburkholderia tropica]OBR54174.1 acyl-CoA dehydrogenase [Paraburkholderia tropica]
MRNVFRDDHELFREQVRRFVEREIAPFHQQWEKDGIVPKSVWRRAGEEGLLCCTIPEEYGGGGGDFGHAAILIEELARVNASGIGFPLHSDIVAPYIHAYGTEEQKREWLPKLASGEHIGAIAMTEPGTGSDLKSVRTTARRDGNDYVINGQKTFITNGQNASLVIVVCKTAPDLGSKGVSLIVVEEGTPGFEKGRKLEKIGLRAQDTSELFFEDVRVSITQRLGEENAGFSYLMRELAQERLVIAVRAVASIEGMLARTIEYTRGRKVFGQAIFDFQNARFKLAHARAKAEMVRIYVDDCIARHLRRELSPVDAAMAKLNATELQNQLLDEFLQLHGGYGYMSEYVIGGAWVDARVMRIYGGTDEIMKEIIARTL